MNRNKAFFYLLLATAAGICLLQAGSLEPPGPPGSTMTTLDLLNSQVEGIPASWYRAGNEPLRFQIVMNAEAALDTETGLVWQRTPSDTTRTWVQAVEDCVFVNDGGRYGWRLPSIEELSTLIDQSNTNPGLPSVHPFNGIQIDTGYWVSTTSHTNSNEAWWVHFGGSGFPIAPAPKLDEKYVWCVRAGIGYNVGPY